MAGETRGEMAEAIAKVAVENALRAKRTNESVFWEESPLNSTIKPDLTIGIDKDHPSHVILVNASDTARNSDIKYWRNIGEIFDSKSRLQSAPAILNIVFKSQIKPELVTLTAALCDATHLVDRDPDHGPEIVRWLEQNHATAPSKKAGKEELVTKAITRGADEFDAEFAKAIHYLEKCLATKLYTKRHELLPLWQLVTSDFQGRLSQTPRAARVTLLRRGLARWLVFDESVREKVLAAHYGGRPLLAADVPDYAKHLGMLYVRVGTGYIPPAPTKDTDQDMVSTTAADLRLAADFFKNAAPNVNMASRGLLESLTNIPAEMARAAEQIRTMPKQVNEWHRYVLDNWKKVCDPFDCYRLLVSCSEADTEADGSEMPATSRVWLYDHLVAILRAVADRNNDFGYGALVSQFKAGMGTVSFDNTMNRIVDSLSSKQAKSSRRWIDNTLPTSAEPGRRGFQDWLAGNKDVSPVVIGAFAFALATLLSKLKKPTAASSDALISAHAYSFWNKLLTHQDFEPLPALIRAACGRSVELRPIPTIMADLAERAVQNAGLMSAFAFPGGLICWKSVTNSGKDHKRKELCGRARALRFRKAGSNFTQSSEAQRLFLVVDGTFDDSDLRVLSESGWDRIFYPDEMDQLVVAIET